MSELLGGWVIDGHTASLFPCSAELAEGLTTENAALAVYPTTAPHARVSLSKARLLNTRQVFLHLVGQAKQKVLTQAMRKDSQLPISEFLFREHVPVDVMLALPKE